MPLLKVIKCFNRLTPQARASESAHYWKRCHPKSDFQWLWQAVHLSTKSAINKPATNYRTIFIAAVFNFVLQAEKVSLKHHKIRQNSVSFRYQYASFQTLHKFSAWTHLSNFDQWEQSLYALVPLWSWNTLHHYLVDVMMKQAQLQKGTSAWRLFPLVFRGDRMKGEDVMTSNVACHAMLWTENSNEHPKTREEQKHDIE